MYHAMRWITEVRFLGGGGGGKSLMLLFARSKPTLGYTRSHVFTSRHYLVGCKQPGREAGHLSPSSAEVGTSGATVPIPIHICGVQFK
jgi:hypothetical protein